jgi:hypothetical protein
VRTFTFKSITPERIPIFLITNDFAIVIYIDNANILLIVSLARRYNDTFTLSLPECRLVVNRSDIAVEPTVELENFVARTNSGF